MDDWNEIKTAAALARHGTIAAAADDLGVHRATVNRHVEHLERLLGVKLFQRHHRGMTPTELGRKLLRIADATNAQLGELVREAKGQSDELVGDFTVTSVDVLSPIVLPYIRRFQRRHPKLSIRYISSDTVLRLSYGEADIAFRIGSKPSAPDNVVLPFQEVRMGIYASKTYIDAHGLPDLDGDLEGHRFVGPDQDAPLAPFVSWARANFPTEKTTFRSSSVALMWLAVTDGVGVGFLPERNALSDCSLIEITAPRDEWSDPTWTVTHVDLHRSHKVQAFLDVLRSRPSGAKSRAKKKATAKKKEKQRPT